MAVVVEVVAEKVRLRQREEEAEEGTVVAEEGSRCWSERLLLVTCVMVVGDHYWQCLCSKRSLLATTKEDGSERSTDIVQREITTGHDQGR
ncbi:hypothetical protein BHE74_00009034 [Ensete ventricosum]|nr:hypothetical protein BHE74_00009034 [Ensete ventricosum]RZR89010.1 hypothetical protein BHM03_00016663 [Ensete ventricosum]